MSYGKSLIISLIYIFSASSFAIAQSESSTLNQQFQEVFENTESFKQYKVVPKTTLNSLFKQVTDSMKKVERQISGLENEISTQQAQISKLNTQLNALNSDLEKSNTMNDSIAFLGVDFQKPVYNILVWSLIILLAVAVGFIYMLFKRSHKITRTTQNDLNRLTTEFDTYKTTAHEKQVKLKRDLQTAMNTLHEKGIKV